MQGLVNCAYPSGFAAGAILTLLPEAYGEGGAVVGLVTTAGCLVAVILSCLEKEPAEAVVL